MENENIPNNEQLGRDYITTAYYEHMQVSLDALQSEGLLSRDTNREMLEIQLTTDSPVESGLDRLDANTQSLLVGLRGFIYAGTYISLSRNDSLSHAHIRVFRDMFTACVSLIEEITDETEIEPWLRVFEMINHMEPFTISRAFLTLSREYNELLSSRLREGD